MSIMDRPVIYFPRAELPMRKPASTVLQKVITTVPIY